MYVEPGARLNLHLDAPYTSTSMKVMNARGCSIIHDRPQVGTTFCHSKSWKNEVELNTTTPSVFYRLRQLALESVESTSLLFLSVEDLADQIS